MLRSAWQKLNPVRINLSGNRKNQSGLMINQANQGQSAWIDRLQVNSTDYLAGSGKKFGGISAVTLYQNN